jgi:DNA-binding IclR family transcriptional regulator
MVYIFKRGKMMVNSNFIDNDDNDKATAIEKALRILMEFTPDNREFGTKEISDIVGYHKATVSRILLTLTSHGFLRQDPRNKTFSLGPSILKLSMALRQFLRNNVIQIAKPYIEELRDRLQETVCLEILSGGVTILGYAAEGTYRVRLAAPVGEVLSPAAAGARAIFSLLDDEPWLKVFERGLERRAEKTVLNVETYRKSLKKARASGVGIDVGGIDDGISAIGVPIFNHKGEPVAAVVMVGLESRISDDPNSTTALDLKRTAKNISAALSCEDNLEFVHENDGLKST